jgi:hypothetical protein
MTRVLRTLGPLQPRRRVVGSALGPREIRARVLSQERAPDYRRHLPRWPEATPLVQSTATEASRALNSGHSYTGPESRRTPSHRGGRITGTVGLAEFDTRVLLFIRSANRAVTRGLVFEAAKRAGVDVPSEGLSLRRHISFSITRLESEGLLDKAGSGGKGDPYRYRVARPLTPVR